MGGVGCLLSLHDVSLCHRSLDQADSQQSQSKQVTDSRIEDADREDRS